MIALIINIFTELKNNAWLLHNAANTQNEADIQRYCFMYMQW